MNENDNNTGVEAEQHKSSNKSDITKSEPEKRPVINRDMLKGAAIMGAAMLLALSGWLLFSSRSNQDVVISEESKELADIVDENVDGIDDLEFKEESEDSIGQEEGSGTEAGPVESGESSLKLIVGWDEGYNEYFQYKIESGKTTADIKITLETTNVDIGGCSISIDTVPDKFGDTGGTTELEPLATQTYGFIDGLHTIKVSCPSTGGDSLNASRTLLVADNLPEECLDYDFTAPDTTTTNLSDFQDAFVGTWVGCVDTPWWTTYFVTIRFDDDASYNAWSSEKLDGNISYGGFYSYSIAGEDSNKIYGITSLQNGLGQGFLDIAHPNGSTVQRGDLRNIRLDANTLKFDFYHRQKYGPLTFMLERQ